MSHVTLAQGGLPAFAPRSQVAPLSAAGNIEGSVGERHVLSPSRGLLSIRRSLDSERPNVTRGQCIRGPLRPIPTLAHPLREWNAGRCRNAVVQASALMLAMLVGACGESAVAQDVGTLAAAGNADLQKFLDMRSFVSSGTSSTTGSPLHAASMKRSMFRSVASSSTSRSAGRTGTIP